MNNAQVLENVWVKPCEIHWIGCHPNRRTPRCLSESCVVIECPPPQDDLVVAHVHCPTRSLPACNCVGPSPVARSCAVLNGLYELWEETWSQLLSEGNESFFGNEVHKLCVWGLTRVQWACRDYVDALCQLLKLLIGCSLRPHKYFVFQYQLSDLMNSS